MTKRHQPDERPDTTGADHHLQPNDRSSRRAMRRRLLQASLSAPMIYTLPHATLAAASTCMVKPGNVLDAQLIHEDEIQTSGSVEGWDARRADRGPRRADRGRGVERGQDRRLERSQGPALPNDGVQRVEVQGLGEHSIGPDGKVQIEGTDYVYQDQQLYTASCAASLAGIEEAPTERFLMERIR